MLISSFFAFSIEGILTCHSMKIKGCILYIIKAMMAEIYLAISVSVPNFYCHSAMAYWHHGLLIINVIINTYHTYWSKAAVSFLVDGWKRLD